MIKAHFKNKSLIIDLSNIGEEYYGKNIIFRLMYGIELTNGENEYFSNEGKISIKFDGQKEAYIKLDNIKDGYRGEKIWIGYYIEADLGRKLLIFRDTKDIDISGREESVFKSSDLELVKSGEYIGYTDNINKKKIVKGSI
ncbi:MAG: hypothetical protein Q9M97_02960 [Candidatus Gracilibacteria bacterium]|nr:hypothetical protein [Candidatus Gracilibacteria bacterium]